MLPSQRHVVILGLLQQQQVIAIQDICTHCDCSQITARRDLTHLEEQGLLRRTHGGAVAAAALPQSLQQAPRPGAPEARLSLLDRSDVLIVTPASTTATRLLVERARRAGVPIIAESISYPGAIAVVAIDDYRVGVELAHWVGSYSQRHMADKVRALDLTTSLPNTAAARPTAASLPAARWGRTCRWRTFGRCTRRSGSMVATPEAWDLRGSREWQVGL